MSRAFVKEPDTELPEALPELPVSPHPNHVTARGLSLLQGRLAETTVRLAAVDEARLGAQAERARLERELRWLHVRVGGAILTEPTDDTRVAFGTIVDVAGEEDGIAYTYAIVGEDEAEPEHGLVSWVSPLARSLSGARVGDTIVWQRPAGDRTLEIRAIRVGPRS